MTIHQPKPAANGAALPPGEPLSAAERPAPERSAQKGDPAVEREFRDGLIELLPFLRAFARSLCGNRELADDIAQEALAKA